MFLDRIGQLSKFRDKQNPAMLDLGGLPSDVMQKLLILAGVGEDTKSKVVVEPQSPDGTVQNFFNFDAFHSTGDGDGTVPIESAAIYKQSVLTLKVRKKWSQVAMHPLFLNDGRVQTLITRFFLNNTSENFTGTPWWSVIDGSVNQLK
ncbi:hypothetical protein [Bacillus xiapuensis]|uniref:Uncharacterized protein n=1 Tax=Bacillus xiapuensis TaxID=2014075 RepID=A0ABU6N9X0_9BACI|nr:hypothetical protein [Bacillus xiapuensis]